MAIMMNIAPKGCDTSHMVSVMGIASESCDTSNNIYDGYYISIAFKFLSFLQISLLLCFIMIYLFFSELHS